MILQLLSVNDLGRLACAFEHTPQPIFTFREGDKWRLLIQFQMDAKRLNYFSVESNRVGSFLGYRNIYGRESVEFFNASNNTSYIYAPVIFLKKAPFELHGHRVSQMKFPSVELEDVGSLVRISAYKIFYEESPLPLFLSSVGSEPVLFTLLSYSEEGPTRMYYVRLNEFPERNFVKYSSDKESFHYTDNVDESGFMYVKVIRLKSFPLNVRIWPSLRG
ncbi:MAG: hypothetical protein ACUVQ8_01900 [Nitrososphaeria archaeon]